MLPHIFFLNPPVDESIVPMLSTSISLKLLTSIPTLSRSVVVSFGAGWSCTLMSVFILFSCLSIVVFEDVYGLFGINDVGVSASIVGLMTME